MHEEIKGGFLAPFPLCVDKGEVKRRRLLSSFQAKCGYWVLSQEENVQPFSAAKTIVGSFCFEAEKGHVYQATVRAYQIQGGM